MLFLRGLSSTFGGARYAASIALWAAFSASCASAPEAVGESSQAPEAVAQQAAPLLESTSYVSNKTAAGAFTLASAGKVAPLVVNASDHAGVLRVANLLRDDLNRVTGVQPTVSQDQAPSGAKEVVLVGTLGKSQLIDTLVSSGKLDVTDVSGKWETYVLQVVEAPMAGVDRALVIAGSDKRATIYGMFDLSQRIGVSPWYWWADVPVTKQTELFVMAGRYSQGTPAVKYRGIFINDENPSLLNWANAQNPPGFKSSFYGRVFELMSRLRANYLWPAMWGKAFNADDSQNPALADEYGIVMGTSHHEPMMRAQQEWANAGYNSSQWNYAGNAATVRSFWQGGITRMGSRESLVTVGMRGDGDEPLANASVSLMTQIVGDQRKILQQVTGKDPATIPQVWALYKEVQDFYDQGMQVPADVSLLFADDNWGNVRRLPDVGHTPRAGGYGIYYHFDYVGDPRNYKWINTNPLPRIWEQLHLSYEKGVNQIWIVNVGDLKPMEFPIEFFLDYAWNPKLWPAERIGEYTRLWAERQFGADKAQAIADVLSKYAKYNSRRKPELLAPDTFSQINYREAERVVADFNQVAADAQAINDALPAAARDAFYELVLYPAKACANLTELYVTAGKNALYYKQGRAATNELADKVTALFNNDAELTKKYHQVANGKWNHMMDQTHIGYTTWQEPERNTAPSVQRLTPPTAAALGVAIEGTDAYWPSSTAMAVLPELSPYLPEGSDAYIDVFNRGTTSFSFTATAANAPWLKITPASGMVQKETRLTVSVDWAGAPSGKQQVPITITGPGTSSVVVQAAINNPETPKLADVNGYVETNGFVSIDAARYTKAVGGAGVSWQTIPDLGRTHSAITAFPVTASSQATPGGTSPHVEYNVHLFKTGEVSVRAYISPSLPFHKKGLRYAISYDDAAPQIVDINRDTSADAWRANVSNNINLTTTKHSLSAAGSHVLKFWFVDTGVVLQKLVVDTGGVRASYLGPPASTPRMGGVEVGEGGKGPGTGTGGTSANGGTTSVGSGGTTGVAGGTTAAGGSSGASGSATTSGGSASAGAAGKGNSGGTTQQGSGGSNGGVNNAGGKTGAAGTPANGGSNGNSNNPAETGCGCRVPATPASNHSAAALLALLGLSLWRRKRGTLPIQ
ncbi:MAG: glycosyl hydrolase 115 family protein [Myxococcota bacterium]